MTDEEMLEPTSGHNPAMDENAVLKQALEIARMRYQQVSDACVDLLDSLAEYQDFGPEVQVTADNLRRILFK